ncbi:MAG TPA: hypothetical protein VLI40_01045, partial [Gemmatimonadaceae bacterium]|nr:hypothetical protein [Gemmatimonadaceae bacterium]
MRTGSSTGPTRESTGDAELHWPHLFEQALSLPRRRFEDSHRWWNRVGVSKRGERLFDITRVVLIALFGAGWVYSIANAKTLVNAGDEVSPVSRARAAITSALPTGDGPTTAYLTDAALTGITDRILGSARGTSGKLKANIEPAPAPLTVDTLPPGATVQYTRGGEV